MTERTFLPQPQLNAIREKRHAIISQARFLLTEANLAQSQGCPPESLWKWIEKRSLSSGPHQSARF